MVRVGDQVRLDAVGQADRLAQEVRPDLEELAGHGLAAHVRRGRHPLEIYRRLVQLLHRVHLQVQRQVQRDLIDAPVAGRELLELELHVAVLGDQAGLPGLEDVLDRVVAQRRPVAVVDPQLHLAVSNENLVDARKDDPLPPVQLDLGILLLVNVGDAERGAQRDLAPDEPELEGHPPPSQACRASAWRAQTSA